jgi:arylsulfatase A-like enzyme
VRAGSTDALASTMDLTATFLDYAGLAVPRDMDSRTLRPLLEGRTKSHREYVLSGLGKWRMAWDGRYKLITGFEGDQPLLYDLARDPLENENIAAAAGNHVKRLLPVLGKA